MTATQDTKPLTGPLVVELPHRSEKKGTVRFDTADEIPLIRTVYIARGWVMAHGGYPHGIRITVEALD